MLRTGEIPRLFAGARERKVAFAAAAGVVQRLVAAIGTLVVFPPVLHALGTDGFGVWGAATSLILLVTVADFGVGPAIVTLVTHAFASETLGKPRDYFTAALVMAAVIAGLLAAGGVMASLCFAPKPMIPIYLIAVAGIAINVPLGTAQSGWQALQRGWVAALWDLVQTAFLVAGLLVAARTTTDARVFVAVVYGALLSATTMSMTSLLVCHPELRPVEWREAARRLGAVVGAGLRYFALSIFDGLSYMLDNVIALQLLGAAASARMLVAQRICVAALGLLMMLAQPLWPAFVDAAARGEGRWMIRALARGSFVVTTAALVGSAFLVLFGPALLKLWLTSNLGVDRGTLWVVAIWIVSLALARVQIMLLNALRILGFQIVVFGMATGVSVMLKFALAPRFGVAGILMATAATFPVIVLPALLWRISLWRKGSLGRVRSQEA